MPVSAQELMDLVAAVYARDYIRFEALLKDCASRLTPGQAEYVRGRIISKVYFGGVNSSTQVS
jgi:hypothetical protein